MIALQKAQEKEQRVEHLAQKAMKRIGNQDITRGFSAWQEQWFTASRHKRMLAAAGARIMRPGLAAAVSHWKADWEAERWTTAALEMKAREKDRVNKIIAANGSSAEQEFAAYKAKAGAELVSEKQAAQKDLERELEMQRTALTGAP